MLLPLLLVEANEFLKFPALGDAGCAVWTVRYPIIHTLNSTAVYCTFLYVGIEITLGVPLGLWQMDVYGQCSFELGYASRSGKMRREGKKATCINRSKKRNQNQLEMIVELILPRPEF